jgi:hypothetical protein
LGSRLRRAACGNLYAEHPAGAYINWVGEVGGAVLFLAGFLSANGNSASNRNADAMIELGIMTVMAFRIYGFIDAWSSVVDYNKALSRRLGLSLNVAHMTTPTGVALGPSLTLPF